MTKAKKKAAAKRPTARAVSSPARRSTTTARRRASAGAQAAMPRSMQHRGGGDLRKAVQTPQQRPAPAKGAAPEGLTRVTQQTEVRGSTTRVEQVVERAPKPSLPDVDRDSTG